MQNRVNRLHERVLPQDPQEAQAQLNAYLFGPVVRFVDEDIHVIQAEQGAVCHTYAVIDAIHKSDISVLLDAYDTEWQCLWKGDAQAQFAFYAPYIVKLQVDTPFTEWLLEQGWGKNWGIFIRSYHSLTALTRHLRKFNQLYSEVDDHWVIFRYYAPEVVKNYLPFLPARDFAEFTDGLTQIIAENRQNNSVLFL
ncbi:DUF4123 domain-containing protein [Serratia microhaemolytica]|uniref:DUF4123 domain-containing protein n=1 Tax=Serratia microhaemolytica TaxID=2675110 RepID=UPI000FDD81EC|nr:DUF4123 domain-containing protein [Serratia microhaemolytica]